MASPLPDIILTNGRVITLDPAHPQCRTVGIARGRITFVNNEDLRKEKTRGAEIIDCRGAAVIPGFIDAHCHLAAYAQGLVTANLEPPSGIRSLEDIKEAIRRAASNLTPGAWVRGRGYDEFYLNEKRHPNRLDLDQATSIHPVKISHRSGNAHVLNSPALSLAGITATTADPPEGIIDRDHTGEPTGLLYGMGGFLAERTPPLGDEELTKGIKKANEKLLARGITSIQDATSQNDIKAWDRFARWKKDGLFSPHIVMMLGFGALKDYDALFSSLPDGGLAARGVKIVIHETTGRLLPAQSELNEMVFAVHRLGLQAVLHAVEEEAIESACLAVEEALKRLPRPDHRHRIEHCSVCPPALAARLAASGIMVVTQPGFIHYNGERYIKTVPPRQAGHLYPLASLFVKGVCVAGSSDFPVAPPDPLMGIYAAISRRTQTGEILLPKEGVPAAQALLLYTANAARSAFEENYKGSIAPGKLADLVVLSKDPVLSHEEEIKEIRVLMTIINGKVAWEKGV